MRPMSPNGTFDACSLALTTSVYRGRPEIIDGGPTDAFDPERAALPYQSAWSIR